MASHIDSVACASSACGRAYSLKFERLRALFIASVVASIERNARRATIDVGRPTRRGADEPRRPKRRYVTGALIGELT